MASKKLWESSLEDHDAVDMREEPQSSDSESELVEDPREDLEDSLEGLQLAQQASQTALERLEILGSIQSTMKAQNVCSAPYMTSLENYTPVLEQIVGNLGVRRSIPSMEDFVNVRRAQSAHNIAMEGLGDFIRKAWEKIKEFFRLFFKRVMVFFKRLVKANLDLESYEKYLDAMMAKLRHNSSKAHPIEGSQPFASKLPVLLADEGMEVMDDNYLLQYGTGKMDRLITIIDRLSGKGIGRFNETDGLTELQRRIQAFINEENGGNLTLDQLQTKSNELRDFAVGLLQSAFENKVTHANELPDSAYSSMVDAMDRSVDKDVDIFSLYPNNASKNGLPKDANVFFAISRESKATVVAGHVYNNIYVRQTIKAPNTFASLQKMYDHYKKAVSKVNVKNMDRSLDKTGEHVIKLLNLMAKDFSAMLDRLDQTRKGASTTSNLTDLYVSAGIRAEQSQSQSDIDISIVHEKTLINLQIDQDSSTVFAEISKTLGDDIFFQIVAGKESNRSRLLRAGTQEDLVRALRENNCSLSDYIETFQKVLGEQLGETYNPEATLQGFERRKEILRDTNRILTNILVNLQSIVRMILDSFHSVYTQLRYEYVRYLYMSAQRFGIER